MAVRHIAAVTFAVRNMAAAVDFYERCGFALIHGGSQAAFTSLQDGEAIINLIDTPGYERSWWGRAIFRVDSADVQYQEMADAGLAPDEPPKNADWGERYFHITDPDGHELSFAERLPAGAS